MQTVVAPLSHGTNRPPISSRPTFLLCPPQWYDVNYVINPWMAGNLHRPSRDRAFQQWRALYECLRDLADVRVLPAEPGSPDMVFVAHAAAVRHGIAALSSFAHRERQAEERYLRQWLEAEGFLLWETPRETSFEGEGDALFDNVHQLLWAAHGVRTCHSAHRHLSSAWFSPVHSLHLVDPRFYHLDTCFAPLNGGHLLWYPEAFDRPSRLLVERSYPADRRIAVTESEAACFACNVISTGDTIITGHSTVKLRDRLTAFGYAVTTLELSEFVRGGGAAKSMALYLGDMPAVVTA